MDSHPEWRRAADLLELSVAERDGRAYRAPPRWARLEVAVVAIVILGVLQVSAQLWLFDRDELWYPGAWFWLVYPLAWWYAARRNPEAGRAVPVDMSEIESRLGRVLEQSRAMAEAGADAGEVAGTMRRIAGGDGDALDARLAAVVLARAQRRLAPSLERHLRLLMDAADRARRRQLQRMSRTQGTDR